MLKCLKGTLITLLYCCTINWLIPCKSTTGVHLQLSWEWLLMPLSRTTPFTWFAPYNMFAEVFKMPGKDFRLASLCATSLEMCRIQILCSIWTLIKFLKLISFYFISNGHLEILLQTTLLANVHILNNISKIQCKINGKHLKEIKSNK